MIPSLHQLLDIVEEKSIDDNLMMLALKDIAHHFCDESRASNQLIYTLFVKEEEYLKMYKVSFIFGVYRNKKGLDRNPAPL